MDPPAGYVWPAHPANRRAPSGILFYLLRTSLFRSQDDWSRIGIMLVFFPIFSTVGRSPIPGQNVP